MPKSRTHAIWKASAANPESAKSAANAARGRPAGGAPARPAAGRAGDAAGPRAAGGLAVAGAADDGAAGAPRRPATLQAKPATPTFSAGAAHTRPESPIAGSSAKPPASEPATAPSVLVA